jgi:hypothetical protein
VLSVRRLYNEDLFELKLVESPGGFKAFERLVRSAVQFDSYTVQEKIMSSKDNGLRQNPIAEFRRPQTKIRIEVLKSLCVIVPVIIWSVIILCSYHW